MNDQRVGAERRSPSFCQVLFFACYPFTAPEDRPLMIYFWKISAMTTGGREARTPAVLVRIKSFPNLLENSVIRTGSVLEVSVEVKFKA